MKNFRYYILSALCSVLIASCAREQEPVVAEQSMNVSISFQTKAGGGSGTIQEPVINCMRVLIFYGVNSEDHETDGNLVFNTFYAFGFNTTRQTGKYNVALANQIVLPQSDCRDYKVYVILNEEGYQQPPVAPATDPTDLHTTLGDFEGNETALKTILSTPAVYTEVLKNVDEPAFLISGCKAVKFGSGELGSVKPVTIEGDDEDGFNRGRSMAEIVINKITSEPAPKSDGTDGDDYTSHEVPLIFVKSVTLENIPNAISWSNDDGKIGTVGATTVSAMSTPIQVGTANSDGYYNREWYGHITRTITNLYAQKVQYTDAKFYRCGNNAGGDPGNIAWSFNVKPYRTTDGAPGPGTAPYTYIYAQGDDVTPKLDDAQKKEDAIKGLEAWAKGNDANKNSTKVLENQISGVFDALQDDNNEMSENISFTSYEVTGVQEKEEAGKNKTTIGDVTLTDDYWTVRLGDKFYVPENIQSTTNNATCLHVTLAIAQPKFSFRLVTPNNKGETDKSVGILTEDLNSLTEDQKKKYKPVNFSDLPSPSSLPGESSLTYTYYAGDSESGNLKQVSEIDANWVKQYGSIAWADDGNHVLEPTSYRKYKGDGSFDKFLGSFSDNHGQFNTYIDGFSRRTAAVQSSIVVNETLKGSEFSWNVPTTDGSTTNDIHIYEYIIPVNNAQFDSDGDNNNDYGVRRNTKYTVTLYVNAATYTDLSTKAGASTPFTITAKVTTEKLDEDED